MIELSKHTKAEIKSERIFITQWNQTVSLDENEWRKLKEFVEFETMMYRKSFEAG